MSGDSLRRPGFDPRKKDLSRKLDDFEENARCHYCSRKLTLGVGQEHRNCDLVSSILSLPPHPSASPGFQFRVPHIRLLPYISYLNPRSHQLTSSESLFAALNRSLTLPSRLCPFRTSPRPLLPRMSVREERPLRSRQREIPRPSSQQHRNECESRRHGYRLPRTLRALR